MKALKARKLAVLLRKKGFDAVAHEHQGTWAVTAAGTVTK